MTWSDVWVAGAFVTGLTAGVVGTIFVFRVVVAWLKNSGR